jgi:hypothetical protein
VDSGQRGWRWARSISRARRIQGAEGALPADYMDETDTELASLLEGYGPKGKIKISVLLARSSIGSRPEDGEINQMRLSDWLPTELVVKAPDRAR